MDIRVIPIASAPEELSVSVTGDKDIALRALALATLAEGRSTIKNLPVDADCLAAIRLFRQSGAKVLTDSSDYLAIDGGPARLGPSDSPSICGGSKAAAKLALGILCGQPFRTTIEDFDPALEHSLEQVIVPLRKLGALITTCTDGDKFTLSTGVKSLRGRDLASLSPGSLAHDSVLFAGLCAEGTTSWLNSATTQSLGSRLLPVFGVKASTDAGRTSIHGRQRVHPARFRIPGNISHASCWMALASVLNIRLHVCDVSLERSGLIFTDLLVRMGVRIREEVKSLGPVMPIGDLDIRGSRLQGITISAPWTQCIPNDIAILAVLSVFAKGRTTIRGLKGEERFRGRLCANLRLMGASVDEYTDGLGISGGQTLRGAELQTDGDSRLTTAFSMAGLLAKGESVLRDIEPTACPDLFESIWRDHFSKMNEPVLPPYLI